MIGPSRLKRFIQWQNSLFTIQDTKIIKIYDRLDQNGWTQTFFYLKALGKKGTLGTDMQHLNDQIKNLGKRTYKARCESPDEGEPMEVSLNLEVFFISFIKENFFIFQIIITHSSLIRPFSLKKELKNCIYGKSVFIIKDVQVLIRNPENILQFRIYDHSILKVCFCVIV